MALIHVSRDLIRSCAVVLSDTPGWRQRPCRSLINLIYGLNSLFASLAFVPFRRGFPRPSVAIKDLDGIRGLANTATRTGNSGTLRVRLTVLCRDNKDSFNLLIFRAAVDREPDHPERVVDDPETLSQLFELAESAPAKLAAMADRAAEPLRNLVRGGGRGGNRNRGAIDDQEIIFELGVIFRNVTGRNPGITRDIEGDHTGPFVRFAQVVLEALGKTLDGRQIMDRLKALDIPEWEPPAWRRRLWKAGYLKDS